MADINQLAGQFVNYYYKTFDEDRRQLKNLYSPESMLSFEGSSTVGAEAIGEKLVNLPFTQIQHKITTMDCQPSAQGSNSIIVFISGQLLIDGQEHPQMFSQTFHLVHNGSSYFVYNDIFRLIYG